MLGQGRKSEGWKVVFNKLFLEPAIVQGDERNNCFTKIQLVGQKYRDKTTLASKTWFSHHCFGFQSQCFLLLVGYNI